MSAEKKQGFIALKKPPLFCWQPPKPSYYLDEDGRNSILIPTHSDDPFADPPGIWQYDLDKQEIINKYKYPNKYFDDSSIVVDRTTFDPINQIIYIIAEDLILSFDLKSKIWTKSVHDIPDFPHCQYIPSPVNELHFVLNDTHFKYDNDTKSVERLSEIKFDGDKDDDMNIKAAKFIYCKQLGIWLAFKSASFLVQSHDVFVCDIKSHNQLSYKWSKYEIKFDEDLDNSGLYTQFDIILAWDQIVFWFDFDEYYQGLDENDEEIYEEIIWVYALDLLDCDDEGKRKWYKSTVEFNVNKIYGEWRAEPHCIKDDNDMVHLMSFRKYQKEEYNYHHRASLWDLLPMECIQINRDKSKPLVHGFIKMFESKNENSHLFLPLYLKDLVLLFYPVFV